MRALRIGAVGSRRRISWRWWVTTPKLGIELCVEGVSPEELLADSPDDEDDELAMKRTIEVTHAGDLHVEKKEST
jgi:hypothetical protein